MRPENILTAVDRTEEGLSCPDCGEHIGEVDRTEDREGAFIKDNCQLCGALLPDPQDGWDPPGVYMTLSEEFVRFLLDEIARDQRERQRPLVFPKDRRKKTVALLGRGQLVIGEEGWTGSRYGKDHYYREEGRTELHHFHMTLLDDADQECPVEVHYYMAETDDRGRFPELDFVLNLRGEMVAWAGLTNRQRRIIDQAVESDAFYGGYSKLWWQL